MTRIDVDVSGLRTLDRVLDRVTEKVAPDLKQGLWRAINGVKKDFLAQTPLKGMRSAKAKPTFRPLAFGDRIDNMGARMYPRRFHASIERFELGLTATPRRAQRFAIALPDNRTRGGKGKPKSGYQSPRMFRRRWPKNRKLVPMRKGGKTYLLEFRKIKGKWQSYGAAFVLLSEMRTPVRLGLQQYWSRTETTKKFVDRVNSRLQPGLGREFGRVRGGARL